jgi:hypothetical protein
MHTNIKIIFQRHHFSPCACSWIYYMLLGSVLRTTKQLSFHPEELEWDKCIQVAAKGLSKVWSIVK